MKTQKEIIKWLRDKGILNLFYNDYNNRRAWLWASDTMKEQLLRGEKIIDDAFRWSDTTEGHEFWSDINEQFLEWY